MVSSGPNQGNDDLFMVGLNSQLMALQLSRNVKKPLVVGNAEVFWQCVPAALQQHPAPDTSILPHMYHPMRRRVWRRCAQVTVVQNANVAHMLLLTLLSYNGWFVY